MKEFYDYYRYAISMLQYKLPVIVIDDIKQHVYAYLDAMTKEDLDSVKSSLVIFYDYYVSSNEVVNNLKKKINENPFKDEINEVFIEQINDLDLKLERLDFIRSFINMTVDYIDGRLFRMDDVKKHV